MTAAQPGPAPRTAYQAGVEARMAKPCPYPLTEAMAAQFRQRLGRRRPAEEAGDEGGEAA
jgi:ribosome modulation factor